MAKTVQTFDEINITPLTDIFLVLLIIMIIVAPMVASQREDIQAPTVSAGASVDPNRLSIEITEEGSIYVAGAPSSLGQLASDLEAQSDAMEEKVVVIRADASARSSVVLSVMGAARQSGIEKVIIAGQVDEEMAAAQAESEA